MEHKINTSTEGLDLTKLSSVLKKNLIWIIVIFIITNTSAYLYIRYTRPLFQSQSELKLDVKSDASELGITGISDNNNLNVISGEIELLKSKLFFSKVIEAVNLDISYFTSGNVLIDEKFKSSPFRIEYKLKNSNLLDKRIYLTILNEKSFSIRFNPDSEEEKQHVYKFGIPVNTADIEFTAYLTENFYSQEDRDFFFIVNSNDSQIKYIADNLNVEPLNINANTIRITFKDHNPIKAKDLINAIDTLYLNYTQQEKSKENTQKIDWLNGELKQIENQLEAYENYFEAFTIDNRTNDLNEDLKKTILAINAIDSQQYILNKKLLRVKSLLSDLDDGNSVDILSNSEQFSNFLSESINSLSEAIQKRETLKLSYKESTFAYKKQEELISNLTKTIEDQIRELEEGYNKELNRLASRKKTLEKEFITLPGKSTEYNQKLRFFNLYEEFYLSLMQSKAQFQIAQAGTTTDFKILSPATLPSTPIAPNKLMVQGIGLVFGFILSLLFIGIKYLLHNKIYSIQEIERLTSAAILGTVPKTQIKLDSTQLVIDKRPKSAVSEALRAIRTNIEFMVSLSTCKIISITSTISGEGKTFIATNLAGIIALTKKKVLILDLDMRKPRVHSAFQDEGGSIGVSTVLINKNTLAEAVRSTEVPGLYYVPAGPMPPNPSELLLNNEFDKLLQQAKLEYDLIILDTPPVGLVTDGILAMKETDLSIYIIRANYSKKIFINTLNRLINVNKFSNLAVILNDSSANGSNSYGYGYYEEKPEGVFNQLRNIINK